MSKRLQQMSLRYKELQSLIWKHKTRLVLTYLLYSLEMMGSLARPFLIGLAINDLIDHRYQGLMTLAGVHIIWLVISYVRHRIDTRTYSTIYTSIVKSLVHHSSLRSDVSRLSARSTLAKDLVDFMEYDVYFILEACYNIFGSLILLAYYQSSLVLLCMAILLPVSVISIWYSRRMRILQKSKNDEFEKQIDILSDGNTQGVHEHFSKLQQWHIRISDQEALNLGMMEIIVMVVICFSLLLSTDGTTSKVQAGDFIGIYYYLLKFLNGLDTIPYALQRWSTLADIMDRLAPNVTLNIKPIQKNDKATLDNPIAA